MRIYIGNENPEGFNKITEPSVLSFTAEDAECEHIYCDNILKKITMANIPVFLSLVRQKLRLNGLFTVKDIDFDLFSYILNKSGDYSQMNSVLFSNGAVESIFNAEYILSLLSSPQFGLELQSKNIDGTNFILVLRRVS
jgi:hypothetical protein